MKLIDIVRDKNKMANFSHYCSGNLYYTLEYDGNTYLFHINSDETGTATFSSEMRVRELQRWIRICLENNEFIKIK